MTPSPTTSGRTTCRATLLAVVAAAALAAGCASKVRLDEPAATTTAATAGTVPPVTASGRIGGAPGTAGAPADRGGVSLVDLSRPPVGAPNDAPSALPPGVGRVVYFDFDSFVVRDEFRPMLEAHARLLATARGRRLVVEGHTDDRGSAEYNLALGQRRAQAVVRALEVLGAPAAQLEAVSFGEERPAATGGDDAASAKNRRAELRER